MKKKKNVLLVLDTSRAISRGILQGVYRYVIEHDVWNVQIEDRGLYEVPSSWIREWKGDGIITRTSSLALAKILYGKNVPIVEQLGNGKQVVADVICDEDVAAGMAVEHFSQAGFTDFGFFSAGNAWWTQTRMEAFCRHVAERQGHLHLFPFAGVGKMTFYPIWEPRYDSTMHRWIRKLPKPIAIWAPSDLLAVRLVECCRRLDIAVPEEVAILGTSNETLICNALTPSLSSIDMNALKIGYIAAERLAQKINGETPCEPLGVVPPLGVVARQSTDIVACHDHRIAAAIRFIRANAMSRINIDDVAEAVDMSRRSLIHHFRMQLGRSIEEEILKTRMDRAKQLLVETDFSLSSISLKVGYCTASYFVQAFKRECGLTPHQFRLENR